MRYEILTVGGICALAYAGGTELVSPYLPGFVARPLIDLHTEVHKVARLDFGVAEPKFKPFRSAPPSFANAPETAQTAAANPDLAPSGGFGTEVKPAGAAVHAAPRREQDGEGAGATFKPVVTEKAPLFGKP